MSIYAAAGSAPVLSYWIWGFIGMFILYYSFTHFVVRTSDGKTYYFWEYLIGIIFGLFFVFYWLNKIGIVPMYPWQLHNWFYKF